MIPDESRISLYEFVPVTRKRPLSPGPVVTSYTPGATSVPPVKVPEPRVTAVPLTTRVGVVVVVVVVVVVGEVLGSAGLLVVVSGAGAPDTAGHVVVDAATGGKVVVGVLVVGGVREWTLWGARR